MKRIFEILVILILFVACSKNETKRALIGKWGTTDNYYDLKEFNFYNDSLIAYEEGEKYYYKWKVNDSKIKVNRFNHTYSEVIERFSLEYKLSKSKDSLFIKRENYSSFNNNFPVLIKIHNGFKHLQKLYNIKIDLPTTEFELVKIEEPKFDIFIGYRNNRLISVSEYSESLDDLKYHVYAKLETLEKEELGKLTFNLVMDKKVPQKSIDSIKKILSLTPVKSIYRTYQSNRKKYSELKWREDLEWFGVLE
jgi:hypothetical protein